MASFPRTLQAILFMTLSMAGFACMAVVIRLLSTEMHPTLMVFLRNLIGLFIVLTWSAYLQKTVPKFPTLRLRSHFWRATAGLVAMELSFYALTIMPLTLATALSFATPIFSTLFAIFFLGEKAGIRRWGAILVGFAGIWVILHPDESGIHIEASIVLLASALTAVAGVLVKSLTRTESPETIVYYMALFMVPWSFFPAMFHWQEITPYQWWLVFLIAFFSTGAHLLLTRAFMRADMVVLMPFEFTRLLFIAVLAYIFIGETMDGYTLAGSLLIIASAAYSAHREASLAQHKKVRPETVPL